MPRRMQGDNGLGPSQQLVLEYLGKADHQLSCETVAEDCYEIGSGCAQEQVYTGPVKYNWAYRILKALVARGLVSKRSNKNPHQYRITPQGRKAL